MFAFLAFLILLQALMSGYFTGLLFAFLMGWAALGSADVRCSIGTLVIERATCESTPCKRSIFKTVKCLPPVLPVLLSGHPTDHARPCRPMSTLLCRTCESRAH